MAGALAQTGFSTVTDLSPVAIAFNTADNTQSKIWTYAGKHWTVLATASGTNIYRLDGTAWTNVLSLASGNTAKADVKVVGNVVHIFTWKGTGSYLYSVQYDPTTDKYKFWTDRVTRVSLTLDVGVQTGTIDIDGNGRMWLASDGNKEMYVRWSDAPYATWSAPIQIASGASSVDVCAVVALPAANKMGFFWSNKITKRFGFVTHADGAAPTEWSADESPSSQSAVNVGGGFADNQFNLKVLPNGNLYSAVKTSYNTAGYPQVGLLLRHPDGTWDPMYPVTTNQGVNPIVIINEAANKLKVVYTLASSIAYKESSASGISFGAPLTLFSGAYDNATSTKANYNSEVVVVASNTTTAVGIIGTDNNGTPPDQTPPTVTGISRLNPLTQTTNATAVTFRIIFSEEVSGVDRSDFTVTVGGTATGLLAADAVTTVAGSNGTSYDVTVTSVGGNGSLRLDLNSSSTGIVDDALNAITTGFNTGQTFTIAQTPPTLVAVSIASNNSSSSVAKTGDIINLSFTASEAISAPSVTIAGHPVTASSTGAQNSYIASYAMVGSDATGNIPFSINFSSTIGTQGIPVTTTTEGSSVTFDKTSPTVVSISRQSPLAESTNALSVAFRITFSEQVNNVNASDFTLSTISGTANGAIAANAVENAGSGGDIFDVTISSITGNGVLRLDLKASGTDIADVAGNAIAGGFNSGESYTIISGGSTSIPTLTSVSISSENAVSSLAKTGDVINLSFTSSDPINPPAVTIASHTVTATAGSGNSFVTSYTMSNTDASGNISFSIDFSNTSGMQGTQVTATTDGTAVSFDKTSPSVISIKRQSPLTEITSTASVIYRAIFSEKINGADAADFMLAVVSGSVNGTLASGATSPVGSDGTTYDITVSSVAGDGVLRLDLKNSATGITDGAGNEIASGFGSGETYTIVPVVIPGGFTSVTPLTPVDLSQPTKDKPQAKVWNYAGKWWCVLSVTAGTKVYRLDGTSWTDILLLNNKSSKPDCRMVGDMVHILCYKGANNNSLMYSLKYEAATNTYKLWTARPAGTSLVFPAGSETATIAVDGTGRMWAASDGATDITVWYSDAPYTSWSAPVTIATGIKSDDICSIIAMPGQNKIGVFWSNQVTKRFGFRTHADGADPAVWSADEIPASQSAINNVGYGMADDHMNLKVASDGTIYCAAKTGYNKDGYAKVILLVRRPSGVWDNQYTVTMNPEGTQPIVLLNETTGKLRMVYASLENGGDILYRESDISNISFGPARTLITSPGILYDYTASSHENFSSEIVILATDLSSTPQRAVGLIATDIGNGNKIAGKIGLESRLTLNDNNQQTIFKAYPNPFGTSAIVSFTLPDAGMYSITLYDVKGTRQTMIKQGWAGAGINNTVQLDGSSLASGIYMIKLLTAKSSHVIKVMVKK